MTYPPAVVAGDPVHHLRDLVAIPSVNPMGRDLGALPEAERSLYSERGVAEHAGGVLRRLGADVEVAGRDPRHPLLLARLDFGARETLALQSHLDTVPVEGMRIPPFDPRVADGRVFGRGSCDTKASMAAYLAALERVLGRGERPTRNVLVLGTHDEEHGFGGARELAARGLHADLALCGEPTGLALVHAHKGVLRFRLLVEGRTAHAALPWLGVSAIRRLAPIVERLGEYADALLLRPPHAALGTATCNLGVVRGGEGVNLVPGRCVLEIDRRQLPDETWAAIRADLERALDGLEGWTLEDPELEAPAYHLPVDADPCRRVAAALASAGIAPRFETAPFATDLAVLGPAGLRGVVFGPGSIELAHTPEESVPVDQLESATRVVEALLLQAL